MVPAVLVVAVPAVLVVAVLVDLAPVKVHLLAVVVLADPVGVHLLVVVVLADPAAVAVSVALQVALVVVVDPEHAAVRKVHSVAQVAQCVVDARANARSVKSLIRCKHRRLVACASARVTAKLFVSPAEHH